MLCIFHFAYKSTTFIFQQKFARNEKWLSQISGFWKVEEACKRIPLFFCCKINTPHPPCSRVNKNSHKSRAPQGVFILGHRKKWLELGRTRAFTAIFGEDFRKSGRIEKEDKKPSVLQWPRWVLCTPDSFLGDVIGSENTTTKSLLVKNQLLLSSTPVTVTLEQL